MAELPKPHRSHEYRRLIYPKRPRNSFRYESLSKWFLNQNLKLRYSCKSSLIAATAIPLLFSGYAFAEDEVAEFLVADFKTGVPPDFANVFFKPKQTGLPSFQDNHMQSIGTAVSTVNLSIPANNIPSDDLEKDVAGQSANKAEDDFYATGTNALVLNTARLTPTASDGRIQLNGYGDDSASQ